MIQRSRSDGDRVLPDDARAAPDAAGAAADQQQEEEEEARSVRCECCGMAEDYTPTYISRARERFHGRWVCGMCAEAVSELRRRDPALAVGEAVESHAKMCSEFNSTVRVNPTLYLALSMRNIARSTCHNRNNRPAPSAAPGGGSRIGRTRSCALPHV